MLAVNSYALPNRLTFSVEMPANARILDVQLLVGTPVMWALVDPAERVVHVRHFRWVKTGEEMPLVVPEWQYVKSLQLAHSALVLHLFEVL